MPSGALLWLLGHLHCMLKVALRQPLLSDPAATQTVSVTVNPKCAGVHYLEQVMCDTPSMPSWEGVIKLAAFENAGGHFSITMQTKPRGWVV